LPFIDRTIFARLAPGGTIPGAIPVTVITGALARHAASLLISVRLTSIARVAITIDSIFAFFTGFVAPRLVALLRGRPLRCLPGRLATVRCRFLLAPVLLDTGARLALFLVRGGWTALLPISIGTARDRGLPS
jgi:hypothetical protein